MHSWYGFMGTFTFPFRRFLEVRRTVKNLQCDIPSNHVSLFNLCSAVIGDVRVIFSSGLLNKIRHFSRGFLKLRRTDKPTPRRNSMTRQWHSDAEGAVSSYLSSSPPAGITVNTRPPWTHLALLHGAGEESQRHFIAESKNTSEQTLRAEL